MQNFLNVYLACKQQQLNGPVSYRGFRETGPWAVNYREFGEMVQLG